MALRFCLIHFAALVASAQMGNLADAVVRMGPGITPPRVLYKVDPTYSPDARADHVQGTVVFEIVVNEQGRATNIRVMSPLGVWPG